MIKHIAGDRDIGQCEVSRLLMSQPLYHSSFDYVTISTNMDSKEINTNPELPSDSTAFKKSLIDYYANRKKLGVCQAHLSKINNLIDFVKLFTTILDLFLPQSISRPIFFRQHYEFAVDMNTATSG